MHRRTTPHGSAAAVIASLLSGCALTLALAGVSAAATPETVTISPADTAQTWQTPILGVGTGLDRSTCVEDVSCDTVRIVLLPGDYTGKRILVSIDWLIQSNDWDLYVFRDHLDGPDAGASHDFIPQ